MNGIPGFLPQNEAFGLIDLLDRPIAFHRALVPLTGSVNAALVLSQAIYWQRRVPDSRDGWWYKTQAEWTEETGLSRREQETARKKLRKAGILYEERRGMPAKMWFRVEMEPIKDLPDRPIAFHRAFVPLTGSVTAALVLSQAIYWQRRVPNPHADWWYKTRLEWTEETGLSRYEQETARKHLREAGFLSEEKRGLPAKIWFRVNSDALVEQLRPKTSVEDPFMAADSSEDSTGGDDAEAFTKALQSHCMAQSNHLDVTQLPIQPKPVDNSSLAQSSHLGSETQPNYLKPIEYGSLAQSIHLESRWMESAIPECRIPSAFYKETEITTETTTTPNPSGTDPGDSGAPIAFDRGGGAELDFPPEKPKVDKSPLLRCGNPLIFPREMSGAEQGAAKKLLAPCGEDSQAILDVLTAIIRAGEVRKSALAVLRGLIARWEQGTFDETTGIHLAVRRKREQEIQARIQVHQPVKSGAAPPPKSGIPTETIEAFRRLRKTTGLI